MPLNLRPWHRLDRPSADHRASDEQPTFPIRNSTFWIRDGRRSVGDTELALRDHLEPRPLEVEGSETPLRHRALLEVVLHPYEGTIRIARRDQAETDDLGRQVRGLKQKGGIP